MEYAIVFVWAFLVLPMTEMIASETTRPAVGASTSAPTPTFTMAWDKPIVPNPLEPGVVVQDVVVEAKGHGTVTMLQITSPHPLRQVSLRKLSGSFSLATDCAVCSLTLTSDFPSAPGDTLRVSVVFQGDPIDIAGMTSALYFVP
jgi:hypothetical protein